MRLKWRDPQRPFKHYRGTVSDFEAFVSMIRRKADDRTTELLAALYASVVIDEGA